MFKKIALENIIKNKAASGVEIILLPDGAFDINAVILKRERATVVTENKFSGIPDIAVLAKSIDPKSPVVLVINGKGVIHKKISVSQNESNAELLNKVLPNADLKDFYIQKQEIDPSHAFISVIRASVVDDIINELKNNNITAVTECYIGPLIVNNVLALIDKNSISNEHLSFSNYKLLIREDLIHEIAFSDEPVTQLLKVEGDQLEGTFLISFAAALSGFVPSGKGLANADVIDSTKENFKQKQKFQFFGWSLLIMTFSILIINYFVFDHYWEKSSQMNSALVLNQSALKKYESLKAEYSQKKGFLEQNGLLENSRTSFYADKLAASVPLSIQLLEMDIHPLKKKEANDLTNAFYFENKVIKVSGKCDRNTELNDWMKEIKKNEWIGNVSLLNYKQDNAKEDGVFFIEVELK